MSDTPRTDAVLKKCQRHHFAFSHDHADALVSVLEEHARQLERELDKREKQLLEVQHQLIQRNAELFRTYPELPVPKPIKWHTREGEDGRMRVCSEAFEHDVELIITGDFYDHEQEAKYAQELAAFLSR